MNLNEEALAFLDAHNHQSDLFITAEFRLFSVLQGEEQVNTIAINRNGHAVYNANDLAREFKELLYDDNHRLAYQLDIARKTIRPSDYTSANPNLNAESVLYIL